MSKLSDSQYVRPLEGREAINVRRLVTMASSPSLQYESTGRVLDQTKDYPTTSKKWYEVVATDMVDCRSWTYWLAFDWGGYQGTHDETIPTWTEKDFSFVE